MWESADNSWKVGLPFHHEDPEAQTRIVSVVSAFTSCPGSNCFLVFSVICLFFTKIETVCKEKHNGSKEIKFNMNLEYLVLQNKDLLKLQGGKP